MRIAANLLLLPAYVVALGVLVRIRTVYRERRGRWFAALQTAMVALVVGHVLAGRPIACAINAAGTLVLAATWWSTGRRQSRPALTD
jgi:hypothetical protein